MEYAKATEQLNNRRARIAEIRQEMRTIQAEIVPEPVEDYVFRTPNGEVQLSTLFGNKSDLFVIHNMGTGCAYCTLWADGFNGVYDHLADRAAFVLSSPDAPEVQQRFARSRNWRFPVVSHQGSNFAADMGYKPAEGWRPGVSVFRKDGDRILRVSDTRFGPGDDFSTPWHFFDLLPAGSDGWGPKYAYGKDAA